MMQTIHANAVIYGTKGLLISGASGSGKSYLTHLILQDHSRFTRLIADDRLYLSVQNERLIAMPHPQIAGLLELRGIGIMPFSYELGAQIHGVIELNEAIERMPIQQPLDIEGISLPYLQMSSKHLDLNLIKAKFA